MRLSLEGIMDRSVWNAARYSLIVLVSVVLIALVSVVAATVVFPYPLHAREAEANPPSLDLILDSLERTEQQNPALSQPYEVTREYKVFREDDPMPVSDIT